MKEPKVGKTYTFVRKRGAGFEHTEFTRHEDGSAGFIADGHYSIFECHPDAWQSALAKLAERGFMELGQARQSGIVPSEWEPTPETSTLALCGHVAPIPVSPPNT